MEPRYQPPKWWLFVFLLLCYFPLFLHLDVLALHLWDEGRRAVNAFEMVQSGHLLIPTYNGNPDMWGTKPPLLIWLQSFFMWMLGYTELAVRLPSALAGLSIVLLLLWFCRRQLGDPITGYFAGLVLLTFPGFFTQAHSFRSGDYDALLTLWLTGGLLFFYIFLQSEAPRHQRGYWWLTTLFLILGIWTKGIAGLFFLPGLFVFALAKGKLGFILKRSDTYLAAGVAIVLGLGYYLLREQLNPGYLQAIVKNELGGRFVEGREGYHYDFWYYIRNMWQERLGWWVYFIPLGIVLGWRAGGRLRDLTLLLSVNSLLLILVISSSKTKMGWYDLPVYPSLAVLSAIPAALLFQVIVTMPALSQGWRRPVITGLFVVVVFAYPYYRIIDEVYQPDKQSHHQWEKMQYGYFMKNFSQRHHYLVGIDEYNPHVNFYIKVLRKRGYDVRVNRLQHPLPKGERVLVCDQRFKDSLQIRQSGNLTPLDYMGSCILYEVTN